MRQIKTALEIALERTENVKTNRANIDQFEAKQLGKKLANAFLAGEADLTDKIKDTPEGQKESLKEGIFSVLISQITLPAGKDDDERLDKVGKGLQTIINTKQFTSLFQQLMQVFSRYLQEAAGFEQVIRQQYGPKLRQKEEELSRRLGREVRIDPFKDPEFVAFFNQNINALKGNYEAIIEQAKEDIRSFFESGNE
ncbi:MAG: hypothetical protein LBI12_00050 [Treponema sp.]|jgi:hypothetical protein|nr:hypothetical protein [Treponema sp.]